MTSFRIVRATAVAAGLSFSLCAASARAKSDQPPMPQPTKEHQLLQKEVGTWDATVKFWEKPGAEPMESKATEKNKMLPGGLWLVSRFEGKFADMPFTGIGELGYDPVEKKYVGTWIDTFSPHMMTMKGDYDAATKTTTMTGETRKPDTGEVCISKQISRMIDDDTRTFEMHMPGEDGKYWTVMKIDYKRRAK